MPILETTALSGSYLEELILLSCQVKGNAVCILVSAPEIFVDDRRVAVQKPQPVDDVKMSLPAVTYMHGVFGTALTVLLGTTAGVHVS